ncbi:MAG: amidohydrolase family protein [Alphaproteobacteria bacterium]|nr:amidohydrolase family protein [Alphaproteobacteria bacterium]
MSEPFDLVIRGGTIADGQGGDLIEGDIATVKGRIAAVGKVEGRGVEEIDARGKLVTPGFVDIHTHYDGQVTWDERLTPSAWHGVTTAVMGNCGVGFAPCRAEDRDRLIRLMEGVEDIPNPVLTEGLPWNWESFADYLDAVEGRRHDIDFAAQMPHGALRVYVMGERGANREPATMEDIVKMAALTREAVRAGAVGFSTSRTLNHRTSDGQPTPTLTAAENELLGIALGLRQAGEGVLQVVSDFADPEQETAMLARIVEESGRPLSFSLLQSDRAPDAWKFLLNWVDQCVARGLPVKAQVCGRPVGLLLGLGATLNPFSAHPSFEAIADRPFAEKLAILKTPEMRATLLGEAPRSDNPFVKAVLRNFSKMYPLNDPPDYEPLPSQSLGAQAAARGVRPEELAYEWMLADEGKALIFFPFLNYSDDTLEPARTMMMHPSTILGLGDGGAHAGMICDSSFPTSMLTYWTRDRTRGEKLSLPYVVQSQTRDTAAAVGLYDRGVLAPGYKADINIIDHDKLTLHRPIIVNDLPAGGRRLVQKADGYVATIVSGRIVYRDGAPTGALPGRLVRGRREAPMARAAE